MNYTISFNEASTDFSKRFGKLLPVVDPAAGSQQDHPWLFHIGIALRQGEIPFINLDNGLGAFLLESLQSGVLYPPNLLLPVMDLSSSQFFDLFQVLHILLLAIGSFLLFRLYIRWQLALILACAFSLITTPAVLPYLIGKREGWMQSVESTARSSFSISPQWLLSWLIPYINGSHQAYYRSSISSNFE
ncbi:hypothetical protein [Leptodesmis sp.]|uniref:hypothetical protein n=1 Tax=Leptodesmis sp. TaxID=3100501 RepID=UPI00405355BE